MLSVVVELGSLQVACLHMEAMDMKRVGAMSQWVRRLHVAGLVDSQGASQNSMQRAKRKAREGVADGGRGKRPARIPDDALMSQMGCSQQVGRRQC